MSGSNGAAKAAERNLRTFDNANYGQDIEGSCLENSDYKHRQSASNEDYKSDLLLKTQYKPIVINHEGEALEYISHGDKTKISAPSFR